MSRLPATVSRVSGAPGIATVTAIAAALGGLAALELNGPVTVVCVVAAMVVAALAGVTVSVSLVCVALPFTMFQISIGQTDWSPLELALISCWAATGLAITRAVAESRSVRPIKASAQPPELILLAASFAMLGGLSMIWLVDGGSAPDALREYRRVILEPLILVPAVAMIGKRGEIHSLVPWLVVPAAIVGGLALGQLALQRSVVEIGSFARPIGSFPHPNNLAFYLERTVWFAPLLTYRSKYLPPVLGLAAAALIAAGCLATLSRGALIAIGAGGAVFLWERVRPRWQLYLAGAAGTGAIIFGSRAIFGDGDSTENRTTIWRASIEMLRDHPFRGVGLDQFFGQYGRRYAGAEGWSERYTSHPHNMVLDFWLRFGLPGLVLLWLLLELTISRVRGAISSPPMTVRRAAVAMLVAGLVHGMIDNSFFLADLATFTWLGLALASPHPNARD